MLTKPPSTQNISAPPSAPWTSPSKKLERAANDVFRFGKSVLRVTPATSLEYLPAALRHTLPHLPKDKPSALVCSGNTCLPPTSDPEELKRLLQKGIAGTAVG